jgi:proline iminopeptidase
MTRLLLALTVALQLTPAAPAEFRARDGATLRYTATGTGPPIVVLSGGPGFSSDYVRPIAERLSGRYRGILLDQRGTGRSTLAVYDRSTVNLAAYLEDLERLRETLGLDQLTLVGHSWGGMLAMAYATRHPQHVRALLLIGPGGPTLEFQRNFSLGIEARLTDEDRRERAYWENPDRMRANRRRAEVMQVMAVMPAYFHDREKARAYVEGVKDEDYEERVFQLMMDDLETIGYDLRPALRTVRIPTLVIQGAQDPIATAEIVRDAIPGARLEMIDRCGHFPWLEQPEAFFSLAAEFLGRVAPGK